MVIKMLNSPILKPRLNLKRSIQPDSRITIRIKPRHHLRAFRSEPRSLITGLIVDSPSLRCKIAVIGDKYRVIETMIGRQGTDRIIGAVAGRDQSNPHEVKPNS
jgi:hypothetical protein